MSSIILIIGACHAHYYAAAFRHCGFSNVKALGTPFGGPIHFRSTLPDLMSKRSAESWFREGGEGRNLVLLQTTASASKRDAIYEDFRQTGVEHTLIRFPFIRFSLFELQGIAEGAGGERKVSRAIRSDRLFNQLALVCPLRSGPP